MTVKFQSEVSGETDMSNSVLADLLTPMNGYARVPRRLEKSYPEIALKDDKKHVVDRLRAIEEVLARQTLGRMVDLGGNVGYFSLSLIDDGMASTSTVYDVNSKALAAGRLMADALGFRDEIAFVKRKLDLRFIRSMAPVDTIICLNLIHHAGVGFDVEEVRRLGWEEYARQWLEHFRAKSRIAILGV